MAHASVDETPARLEDRYPGATLGGLLVLGLCGASLLIFLLVELVTFS